MNWKAIAQALDAGIPERDLPRVTTPLEALEAAFRPAASELKPADEPAGVFCVEETDE
jgi:hypothetical protein